MQIRPQQRFGKEGRQRARVGCHAPIGLKCGSRLYVLPRQRSHCLSRRRSKEVFPPSASVPPIYQGGALRPQKTKPKHQPTWEEGGGRSTSAEKRPSCASIHGPRCHIGLAIAGGHSSSSPGVPLLRRKKSFILVGAVGPRRKRVRKIPGHGKQRKPCPLPFCAHHGGPALDAPTSTSPHSARPKRAC
jgi:hypothetical protein